MSFIDEDYRSLEQTTEQFQNHFESAYNPVARSLTLLHTLHYLVFVKDKIKENEGSDHESLRDEQLKPLREKDTAVYLGRLIAENYCAIQKENENEAFP